MAGVLRFLETIFEGLKKRIHANQKYVPKRRVAFYKLSQLGHFNLLASAESRNEY
jgi:hypothetical protein